MEDIPRFSLEQDGDDEASMEWSETPLELSDVDDSLLVAVPRFQKKRTFSSMQEKKEKILQGEALGAMFGLNGMGRNWRRALKKFHALEELQATTSSKGDQSNIFSYFLKDDAPTEQYWIDQVHKLVDLARANDANAFRAIGFLLRGHFAYGRYKFFNPRLARYCFEHANRLDGPGSKACCEDFCVPTESYSRPIPMNLDDENIGRLVSWISEHWTLRNDEYEGEEFSSCLRSAKRQRTNE